MSEYVATIRWQRGTDRFTDDKYSREHEWVFDGGLMVPASASPDIVPLPMSVAKNVDPEEAFVASLSSCHMLFFLHIAANSGYVVDRSSHRCRVAICCSFSTSPPIQDMSSMITRMKQAAACRKTTKARR
jgi:organic hydroperoxide reductase OsmC/OhrA